MAAGDCGSVGEIPCFLTAFAQDYTQLLVLRIFSGIGLGGTVPIVFSFLGDLFTDQQRPASQAWWQAFTSLGILVGMLVAGFLGPALGWRIPFILVSAPNFLLLLLMVLFGKEPKRGGGEQEIKDLILKGEGIYAANPPAGIYQPGENPLQHLAFPARNSGNRSLGYPSLLPDYVLRATQRVLGGAGHHHAVGFRNRQHCR